MAALILRQLFNLNQFIAYTVLIFVPAMSLLHHLPGPGYLIPVLLAFLLVYVFRLIPNRPQLGRKRFGFYAGQSLTTLGNGLVILSIGLPVLWSNVAGDEDLLLLLWLAIPALIVAAPCWIIGALLVWFFGARRLPVATITNSILMIALHP